MLYLKNQNMTVVFGKFSTLIVLTLTLFIQPASAQVSSEFSGSAKLNELIKNENHNIPSPASPRCCFRFYDHRHANSNTIKIMQNFNQRISTMQLAIIEALRLSTGQISGTIREQTAARHSLADKQDDRTTVKAIESVRMDAMKDAMSGSASCAIISGSNGGATTRQADQFKANLATKVNSWSEGDPNVSSSLGPDQAALALTDSHCSNYATAKSVDSGLCEKEGSIPGGDTNIAESIFYQSDNVGYRLPKDRIDASTAFILTAVDPTPVRPISEAQVNTPQGKIMATLRNASIARVSTANETLSYLTSQRKPIDDESLKNWATQHASGMRGLEELDFSGGVSHIDWLRLQSQHFLLHPDWVKNSDINLATATKATKNVLAVLAYQGFENYKLMERIAANLAIQTAILNSQLQKQ